MPSGLYDADGKIRLTQSPGSGFCGLYAPDGSWYFTTAPGSGFCGSTAPDGSLYVVDATGSTTVGRYATNGAIRATTANENNGALRVSGLAYIPTNFVYITGDRRASITISASAGLMNGVLSNMLNGVVTQTSTFFSVVALNGTQYIQFDFGSTAYVNEVQYYQNVSAAQGTWKWQGSNDASSWTDIGGTLIPTWGGSSSTPFLMTTLNSNLTGYRYYRMLGVSGSTSGSPWVQQFQFKQGS